MPPLCCSTPVVQTRSARGCGEASPPPSGELKGPSRQVDGGQEGGGQEGARSTCSRPRGDLSRFSQAQLVTRSCPGVLLCSAEGRGLFLQAQRAAGCLNNRA